MNRSTQKTNAEQLFQFFCAIMFRLCWRNVNFVVDFLAIQTLRRLATRLEETTRVLTKTGSLSAKNTNLPRIFLLLPKMSKKRKTLSTQRATQLSISRRF